MSKSPDLTLSDPDPLSILLSRLALSAEVYVSGDFCGTWAVDTSGSKRIPFHLIGEGTAWLHAENQAAQPLGKGSLLIFPHDSHHIITSSQSKPAQELVNAPLGTEGDVTQMICGFFEFKNPSIFPVLEHLSPVVKIDASQSSETKHLERLVELLIFELQQSRPGYYAVLDQIAFLIFVEALRQQVQVGQVNSGLLKGLFDPRIGRALSAIHKQPEQNWNLATLADVATMSRSGFAQNFSEVVGESPMKYLALWRMNEARRLLRTTNLSTVDIAERSGYSSEAAFRKAYRSILGEPPGAERARRKSSA